MKIKPNSVVLAFNGPEEDATEPLEITFGKPVDGMLPEATIKGVVYEYKGRYQAKFADKKKKLAHAWQASDGSTLVICSRSGESFLVQHNAA